MLICDLIEDLRRFPQGARIIKGDKGQMLVDVSPLEKDGCTVFDVSCPNEDLPDELRRSAESYECA